MGVLAMLELDGDRDALLGAMGRLEELLGRPDGLLARIVAPTETGIVLFQHWASVEARERNDGDAVHGDALRSSGLLDAITARRGRVFDDAVLQAWDAGA